MDNAQFRINFPEFADIVRFPDSMLDTYSSVGECLISDKRLGACYTYAIQLFTAHHVALAEQSLASSQGGGTTASIGGDATVASKSIAGKSISFHNNAALSSTAGAGQYNITKYGVQYTDLLKKFGRGAMVLG